MVQRTLCHAWFHYTCGLPNWIKSQGTFGFVANVTSRGFNSLQFVFVSVVIHAYLVSPNAFYNRAGLCTVIGFQMTSPFHLKSWFTVPYIKISYV